MSVKAKIKRSRIQTLSFHSRTAMAKLTLTHVQKSGERGQAPMSEGSVYDKGVKSTFLIEGLTTVKID